MLDGLEVVHDLSQIGIAVVKGNESDVVGTRYSKDVKMEFNRVEAEHHDLRDHHLHDTRYDLQWDKQAQDVLKVHRMTRGEGTCVSPSSTPGRSRHIRI